MLPDSQDMPAAAAQRTGDITVPRAIDRQFGGPKRPIILWLGGVGCALGLLLLAVPAIAKPFYLTWYLLACSIGIVVSNVLVVVFFYVAITGIGLLMRAMGKRPIRKGFDKNAKTYWENVEDKSEIVAIDIKTFKVLNHWSIAPAEGPTGLAYDKATKRLFAGCDKKLAVVDATSGKVIATPTIGDGCDGVAFDAAKKNVYTANGDGTITVVHEDAADKFTITENAVTKKSARTIAIDKTTGLLYLPAAEFEAMEPGQKGRPKMKAGTFQVLVVGK